MGQTNSRLLQDCMNANAFSRKNGQTALNETIDKLGTICCLLIKKSAILDPLHCCNFLC